MRTPAQKLGIAIGILFGITIFAAIVTSSVDNTETTPSTNSSTDESSIENIPENASFDPRVIAPPSEDDNASAESPPETLEPRQNIYDVISPSDVLFRFLNGTFVTGISDTLSSNQSFTVFAPNDASYEKLDSSTFGTLTNGENSSLLRNTLNNHIIRGSLRSSDLSDGQNVQTLLGRTLRVQKDGSTITLTDSRGVSGEIVAPDIKAANGFVHIVDTVFTP